MQKGRRKKSGTDIADFADCRLPIADCRLPIAAPFPIADCRFVPVAIADCRINCRLPANTPSRRNSHVVSFADCRQVTGRKCGNFYRHAGYAVSFDYEIMTALRDAFAKSIGAAMCRRDEKRKDGGVFSRKGYDAKLRLNIPNAKFLKAAVYYNFGDEHGAESDDGFRYGAEAHLIPGLRIALLYDNGEEELGGEVSYIHTIGEVQQAQTANEQWTPDLFAAVSREHSQRIERIISVSVQAIAEPQIRTSVMITTLIMITPQTLRVANVLFSITILNVAGQAILVSTRPKIEMTLPPATASRPYVLTIMRNFNNDFRGRNDANSPVIVSAYAPVLVGTGYRFGIGETGPR